MIPSRRAAAGTSRPVWPGGHRQLRRPRSIGGGRRLGERGVDPDPLAADRGPARPRFFLTVRRVADIMAPISWMKGMTRAMADADPGAAATTQLLA